MLEVTSLPFKNLCLGFFMKLQQQVSFAKTLALAIFFLSLSSLVPKAHGQVVRTGWTSIVSASSGKCVDIAGMQTTDNAAAVQWPCQFSVNEQWTVHPVGSGFNVSFQILEQQTGKCLVPLGANKGLGASIVQLACTGQPVELWNFLPAAKGYKIQSAYSGLCMTTNQDSAADNAALQQQACTDATLVTWIFKSGLLTQGNYATFQPNHSGECIVESGVAAGASVVQSACAGVAAEQWRLIAFQGAYVVQSQESGDCFDIASGSTAANAPMIQWGCSGSANQLFTLLPSSTGGSYQLQSVNSGMCLDLSGGTTTSGTQVTQAPCANVNHQQWSISNATVPSSWTAVTPLTVNPIGVANLPNGKLMTWSAYDLYNYEIDIGLSTGQTYTSIFDPVAMQSGAATVTTTGSDMFCPGTANLVDGRILVNGGSSSPKTTIFDPASGNWTVDAVMNIPRGYEADTVLSNGSVFTLGGSWTTTDLNTGKSGEVWTKGSGWKLLSTVPEDPFIGPDPNGTFRGDNHMWLFAQSNGRVFHAGPSSAMHWIDTSGTGTTTSAGNRADDAYSINGNAVMYDIGKILKAGGAPAYDNGVATTASYTITLNGGVNVTKVAPMTYPRGFSNGVALPTGQVLIVGGQTFALAFTDTGAVLTPELWDPLTGVFQQLSPMQTPRTYHSTAILLPDGRVFVGGGGQCGNGCVENHFNTEILTPPYLLNANGTPAARPTITSAPATAARGTYIAVTTDTPVVSFALMRLSSTTHTVNNDQRRIPLNVQADTINGSSNTYALSIPSDSGVALPGYYMLFAINAQDVPSVAATVLIQ
jgi:galactose oxidase